MNCEGLRIKQDTQHYQIIRSRRYQHDELVFEAAPIVLA